MDASKQPSGDISVRLSYAEAVVLSELLSRWERDGAQENLPLADQAEQRVLWDLAALFEPLIDEVFDKHGYDAIVSHSRSQVRDSNER